MVLATKFKDRLTSRKLLRGSGVRSMIEIDGSMHSGSGTLLRYAVALATLRREALHMTRIRAKRPKPGLRAQHLNAVTSCCAISGGQVDGAEVGSQEIVYRPGDDLKGGDFEFDIGTAGSATMAAFTLIPPCLFARKTSRCDHHRRSLPGFCP